MDEYNGWANKPTWIVGMYIDGNYTGEATCREYEAMVATYAAEGVGDHEFAADLKERVEADLLSESSMSLAMADLFGWALATVDWTEIASTRLADAKTAA